jgi:hypothetical protein
MPDMPEGAQQSLAHSSQEVRMQYTPEQLEAAESLPHAALLAALVRAGVLEEDRQDQHAGHACWLDPYTDQPTNSECGPMRRERRYVTNWEEL